MKRIFTLLLISFFLLAGCSSKLAYNNIDWLLYWYLDDYIELDREQKNLFDGNLDSWLIWHRSQELAEYQQHLRLLQQQVRDDQIGPAEVAQHFALAEGHWLRARDKISPELLALAPKLSDEQVIELFETLEKNNLKREKKRSKKTRQERQEDRIERGEDQLKDWVGRLSTEQKTTITAYSSQFVSTFDEWMLYRRNIQNEVKTLLLQRNENPQFEAQLLSLIQHPEAYQQQAYIENLAANRRIFNEMLLEMSASLSDKQRRKLLKKLQGLIEDLDELIED